jgi:hypothetical protein
VAVSATHGCQLEAWRPNWLVEDYVPKYSSPTPANAEFFR